MTENDQPSPELESSIREFKEAENILVNQGGASIVLASQADQSPLLTLDIDDQGQWTLNGRATDFFGKPDMPLPPDDLWASDPLTLANIYGLSTNPQLRKYVLISVEMNSKQIYVHEQRIENLLKRTQTQNLRDLINAMQAQINQNTRS